MRSKAFWQIIERARNVAGNDPIDVALALKGDLGTRDPDEIVSFDDAWEDAFRGLHRFELWGAAFVIGGGCSDDLFDYFKGYLISYGKRVYDVAKRRPDSLADVMAQGSYIEDWELLMYPAWDAYREVTGHDIPLKPRPFINPSGPRWDEDDLPRLYPRLYQLFDESPAQRQQREFENGRVQTALSEHGDQLDIPRQVTHVALFPSTRLAQRAAYVFRELGFTTNEPQRSDDHVVLEFHREDRVDGDHPNTFTDQIVSHLPHYTGTYDGWGSNITRGSSDQPPQIPPNPNSA